MTSTVDTLLKALKRLQKAQRYAELGITVPKAEQQVQDAVAALERRVDYHTAVALRVDNWLPACNGTEIPFKTRSGRTVLYCWNPATGKHGYIDTGTDMLLSGEDAYEALHGYYQAVS